MSSGSSLRGVAEFIEVRPSDISGAAEFIGVRYGRRRVHPEPLRSFKCALGVVAFIRGAQWGS